MIWLGIGQAIVACHIVVWLQVKTGISQEKDSTLSLYVVTYRTLIAGSAMPAP